MKRSVYSFIFALQMKVIHRISKKLIVFSQWSRKSYAIFASLGKVVKIARVSAEICDKAMKKSVAVTGLAQRTVSFEKEFSDALEKLRHAVGVSDGSSEALTFLVKLLQINTISLSQNEGGLENYFKMHRNAHVLVTIKHGHCNYQAGGNDYGY